VLIKLKSVVRAQLLQGLHPHACCRAVAVAITIGLFPILGVSTFINTCCAATFRLNQPIVQVCNWIIGPIKIALIFPFLRLGEVLFKAPPLKLSLREFSQRFYSDIGGTTVEFAWTFTHAIVGWMACAPFIYWVIFRFSKVLLSHRYDVSMPDKRHPRYEEEMLFSGQRSKK
jgi:uncharacterized protein (DUF2062 family)